VLYIVKTSFDALRSHVIFPAITLTMCDNDLGL